MIIFITDYLYMPKLNKEIILNNDAIEYNIPNSSDEFEKNIKFYIKDHADANLLFSANNILNIFGIDQYYKSKSSIKNALKNKELIIYTLFYYCNEEKSIDEYSDYGIYNNFNKSYLERKNLFSCGTKYVYYYQYNKLQIYDCYGIFVPYLSITDIRVSRNLNQNIEYNIGDRVQFFNQENHIGIIDNIIKPRQSFPFIYYEIIEDNGKLYYNSDAIIQDDIIRKIN